MPGNPFARLKERLAKARARRGVKISKLREKKHYQLSEALTLYMKAMDEFAKRMRYRFPNFARGVKEFEKALKRGDVKILVEPGMYLQKTGKAITKARIIYRPGSSFIIELPSGSFDLEGNLRPEAMMDLFHELTHGVRAFIPEIERLPTAYDEATTNYLAKWAGSYVAEMIRKKKPKYLLVSPNQLKESIRIWERDLMFRPEMVEGVLGRIPPKVNPEIYREFARGWLIKKKVRELAIKELARKVAGEIKLSEEIRKLHEIKAFRRIIGRDYERIKNKIKLPRGPGGLTPILSPGHYDENIRLLVAIKDAMKKEPRLASNLKIKHLLKKRISKPA